MGTWFSASFALALARAGPGGGKERVNEFCARYMVAHLNSCSNQTDRLMQVPFW